MLIHSDIECTFEQGHKPEGGRSARRNILIGVFENVSLDNTHSPAAQSKDPEHQRYMVNPVLQLQRAGRNFTLSL